MKRTLLTIILLLSCVSSFAQWPVKSGHPTHVLPASFDGTIHVDSYMGQTDGGTRVVYTLDFDLHKELDWYYPGTLTINGWLYYAKVAVGGYCSEEEGWIKIRFQHCIEGFMDDVKKDTLLLEFRLQKPFADEQFKAIWGTPLKDFINKDNKVTYDFTRVFDWE